MLDCQKLDDPYLPDNISDHSITGQWSKYVISGSSLKRIIQTDTGTSENWRLGRYHNTKGATTFYNRGTYCDPIKADRSAKIQWRCGTRNYEIISVTEPSTCVYHLIGEVRCNNLTSKGLLIATIFLVR